MQKDVIPDWMIKQGCTPTAATRFWRKVRKTEGCWIWTANALPKGYGVFAYGGRGFSYGLAHRFSWMLANGPIPDGKCVLHRCDNPPCVRPDHLFIGTKKENLWDAIVKGRFYGGKEGWKLTSKKVIEIRERYSFWKTTMEMLAKEYRVSRGTILKIIHRKTWKHVR